MYFYYFCKLFSTIVLWLCFIDFGNRFVLKVEKNIKSIEEGLARARLAIRKAARTRRYLSYKDEGFIPRGSIYRNPYAFHQLRIPLKLVTIVLMEKLILYQFMYTANTF